MPNDTEGGCFSYSRNYPCKMYRHTHTHTPLITEIPFGLTPLLLGPGRGCSQLVPEGPLLMLPVRTAPTRAQVRGHLRGGGDPGRSASLPSLSGIRGEIQTH